MVSEIAPCREDIQIRSAHVNATPVASNPQEQNIPDMVSKSDTNMMLKNTVQNAELKKCTLALVEQGESRL